MIASAVRAVFALAVAALVVSALTGGPLRISLTPSVMKIATEIRTEHALPRGTKLKIGYPEDPLVLAYDKKGRVVLTPPREKTLVDVLQDSMKGLGSLRPQEAEALTSGDP
jgi:hypothetical protein